MAKIKHQYTCSRCGCVHSKWAGQCADCGEWNTLSESLVEKEAANTSPRFSGYAGQSSVQDMHEIQLEEEPRSATGIIELDRVLGGGLVHGSVVLMGATPALANPPCSPRPWPPWVRKCVHSMSPARNRCSR